MFSTKIIEDRIKLFTEGRNDSHVHIFHYEHDRIPHLSIPNNIVHDSTKMQVHKHPYANDSSISLQYQQNQRQDLK